MTSLAIFDDVVNCYIRYYTGILHITGQNLMVFCYNFYFEQQKTMKISPIDFRFLIYINVTFSNSKFNILTYKGVFKVGHHKCIKKRIDSSIYRTTCFIRFKCREFKFFFEYSPKRISTAEWQGKDIGKSSCY
jgi:hypothetical protein